MLLLTCPACGVTAEETEFAPGGEAHLKPCRPGLLGRDVRRLPVPAQEPARRAFRALAPRLRLRQVVPPRPLHRDPRGLRQLPGPPRRPAGGARRRDPRPAPRLAGPAVSARLARGGLLIDRERAGRISLERQGVARLRRRHAGLGAARQRPGAGRALVQVPPPARHRRERRRGAERARRPRRGRPSSSRTPARPRSICARASSPAARTTGRASNSISAPSPAASRRSCRRGSTTRPSSIPAPPGSTLFEPADPPVGRPRRRAGSAGSRQLRLRLRACRRAGRRRRGRRPRGGVGGGRLGRAGAAGRAGRRTGADGRWPTT